MVAMVINSNKKLTKLVLLGTLVHHRLYKLKLFISCTYKSWPLVNLDLFSPLGPILGHMGFQWK